LLKETNRVLLCCHFYMHSRTVHITLIRYTGGADCQTAKVQFTDVYSMR
jgi:hypothetical protein